MDFACYNGREGKLVQLEERNRGDADRFLSVVFGPFVAARFFLEHYYTILMDRSFEFDFEEALKRLVRYLLEGFSVGIAVQIISQKKVNLQEVILVAVTASAVLCLLDSFSPTVSRGARSGMGLGLGLGTVGYKGFVPYAV